jgi:hypothetical protein
MDAVVGRNRGSLALVGGLAATLAAAILVVGVFGLAAGSSGIRPWLSVLLGINAGVGGVTLGSLRVVNIIDVAILLAAGVAFAGFWPGPGGPHKVWMGLAILLPFAGIAVLLATGLAGRSGLMGGGLVLSVLMIGSPARRVLGYLGVVANLLLLAGDFATAGPSAVVAGVVGVGYVLLVVWLLWGAVALIAARPGSDAAHT